ncbi:MAG: cyclodeaminase/cyclohydrolase family protein [Coriobacteriales bacterium]|jgi:formiminotetrahydrofolate cyclodeaminase|nr:cyclodeaminase/cyclohydrolase family protein [Coriobacteriales bacterium]
MNDRVSLSCADFVRQLASKAPAPGGGGASALVGALGVALGNMVGALTVGKPKYAAVQTEIADLMRRADVLQQALLELVARDAEVFESLTRAYRLPFSTKEERLTRAQVTEECLRECCAVPLRIMERCCEAIDLHEQFALKGTILAISDVGVGVICCKAALQGASLNVFINTQSMADRDHAAKINARADKLLKKYANKADALFLEVAGQLRQ